MHGIDLVLRAVVMHKMDFAGIGISAAGLVAQNRTIFPTTFPQLVNQGHVLVCQIVTVVMRGLAC